MMTLYHGSDQKVAEPLARIGRSNLDFGKGFYVTKIDAQAHKWAKVIAARKGRRVIPIVSIYRFDRARAVDDGVRFSPYRPYCGHRYKGYAS